MVTGAGVSGLAAALAASRRGFEVEVWEGQQDPGGMLQPYRFRGIECDLGSHRLHPAALREPFMRQLATDAGLATRVRRGRIVLNRRHIPYPLSLPGLLRGLGPRTTCHFVGGLAGRGRALLSWEKDRSTLAGQDVGFATFVRRRVGDAAYQAFYRPYAEKVWGIDPEALSQTVAKRRVSTSSPARALGLLKQRRDEQTFLYPRGGMHRLIGALRRQLREVGGRIRFGQSFCGDPSSVDADAVLHSGHLGDLVPGSRLAHNGLYLLFLAFEHGALAESATDTWYLPEDCYWFGRVSQPASFCKQLSRPGESVLCVEIPQGRWGDSTDFTARTDVIVDQLARAGILRRAAAPLEARQRFIPRVYPMYTRGFHAEWRRTLERATESDRLLPFGRQGLFLHCNIDHCIGAACAAVDHVERGRGGAAWAKEADRWLGVSVRD